MDEKLQRKKLLKIARREKLQKLKLKKIEFKIKQKSKNLSVTDEDDDDIDSNKFTDEEKSDLEEKKKKIGKEKLVLLNFYKILFFRIKKNCI